MTAAVVALSAPPEAVRIEEVEHLHGAPGHSKEMRGELRVSPDGLEFTAGREGRFRLEGDTVDYVAAEGDVRERALLADIGSFITAELTDRGGRAAANMATNPYAIFMTPLLGAAPFLYMLREKEKSLLSVEYLEGEERIRRLVVFRVRNNPAVAVKKMIDETLGLTAEHYHERGRQEEVQRRKLERLVKPAGVWKAAGNIVAGNSRRSRILVEAGRYEVLFCGGYVGLRPEEMEWAKYRIAVGEVKEGEQKARPLEPIYKDERLAGFEAGGFQRLFH